MVRNFWGCHMRSAPWQLSRGIVFDLLQLPLVGEETAEKDQHRYRKYLAGPWQMQATKKYVKDFRWFQTFTLCKRCTRTNWGPHWAGPFRVEWWVRRVCRRAQLGCCCRVCRNCLCRLWHRCGTLQVIQMWSDLKIAHVTALKKPNLRHCWNDLWSTGQKVKGYPNHPNRYVSICRSYGAIIDSAQFF